MSNKVQTKVYLPEELKTLLDADERDNSEAVEAALWREYGGEKLPAMKAKLEKKKDHRTAVVNEKASLTDELDDLEKEIQALEKRINKKQREKETTFEDALQEFSLTKLASMEEPMLDATDDELNQWAEKLEMDTEELHERLYDKLLQESDY